MGHLDGKRIVITGSTRGLGRAFAEEMARAGARVVVNGTQAALVDEVVAGIRAAGGTAIGLAGSIAEESTAARLVAACVDNWGGIDTIVHNAGIVRDKTLLKMTAEEFDDVIAVHLRGAFFCIKHAGIAMKAGGGGHIILVISGSGLAGGFGQGNYAAAKEGMMGLLRTAALELTKSGIRCNALWPIAETDMTQVVFERAAATAEAAGQPAPGRSTWVLANPVRWRRAWCGWRVTRRRTCRASALRSTVARPRCGPIQRRRVSRSMPGRGVSKTWRFTMRRLRSNRSGARGWWNSGAPRACRRRG
ncbi:MAG: SDR family NAD(P)-dependent oxidoreductase [Pseudomonadales bacterium]